MNYGQSYAVPPGPQNGQPPYTQQQPNYYSTPQQQQGYYGQPAGPVYATPYSAQQQSGPYASAPAPQQPLNYKAAPSPVNIPTSPIPQHFNSGGGDGEKGSALLAARPKFQDIWASILFVLQLIAFIVLAVIFVRYFVDNFRAGGGGATNPIDAKTLNYYLYVLLGTTGGSLLFTIAYLGLCYVAPGAMIHITFALTIGLYLAATVWSAINRQFYVAAVFGVLSALHILFYFIWRHRIPFAALMLKSVMAVIGIYPATLLMPALSLFIQLGFSIVWGLTIAGMQLRYTNLNYGLLIYLIFSFYWTTQVIKNTTHVTTSGVFASYYFLYGTDLILKNPTLNAFKRAISYAFGSICFGSLIVALIQTLRALVRSSARDGSIVAACLNCILSMIESLIEYFNYYAYIQVAIYGKSFCNAAKDTWTLVKSCGIDIIVNDDFIGTVLGFGIFLCGAICALISFLVTSGAGLSGEHIGIITAAAAIIGWVFMIVATEVISSGVATTMVCLAEDPHALARTKPELYRQIQSVYPQVRFV